ncbi:MAG: TIGR04211 family SH3 domain-containing protein [Gammaproteobacteria bacterium]
MKSILHKAPHFVAVLLVLAIGQSALAQTRYVTDQFEITLRTGPSTSNQIVRMLPSGTRLETIEVDAEAGWTRVRTSGGTEGWVLTRYLMGDPAARDQLASMRERLETMRGESGSLGARVDDLSQANQEAQTRIRSLESENKQLEAELAEIKRTASNVLAIDSENNALREQLSTAEVQIAALQQENGELSSRRNRDWFIAGAAVLLAGVLLGIILPRIRWRKRSRWSDSF